MLSNEESAEISGTMIRQIKYSCRHNEEDLGFVHDVSAGKCFLFSGGSSVTRYTVIFINIH